MGKIKILEKIGNWLFNIKTLLYPIYCPDLGGRINK